MTPQTFATTGSRWRQRGLALRLHLGAVVEGRFVHKSTAAEPKPVELKLAKTQ
jgi:hypothetical protein